MVQSNPLENCKNWVLFKN